MKYLGKTGEYFELADIDGTNCHLLKETKASELSLLWFKSNDNCLSIDSIDYTFQTNEIVSLTEFHQVKVRRVNGLILLRWNRPFYCILDHDSEVGCKGILYYGASSIPIITPSKQDLETLIAAWKMLELEMGSKDSLQLEMLQMMLKRILILCTRIYKSQANYEVLNYQNIDLIREYNFLVEQHFREKHTVADYADLLHKSPKTLSNLFKKIGNKAPLQFIHDRKMLEARRLLSYTDKSISEIGYELGVSEVQSFSRFFKNQEGISPADYKKTGVREKLPTARES